MNRRHLVAIVAAAVLGLTGCNDALPDDPAPTKPTASKHPSKGPSKGPGTPDPRPTGPTDPGPTSPSPKDSPWKQKGPATLTGCGTVKRGLTCSFQGSNFKPGEKIYFSRDGAQKHVFTADERGGFAQDIGDITTLGAHTYTARGAESHVEASTTVQVTEGVFP
ncbi:hypothetical protein ACIGFK_34295 [Streptomyces sp. NPDC085524]|uniref:hypothetical protein n=1 Tax=Streptomyces sp. NPDC085524 TaxID=3365728 RepID=UPI0037D15EE2